MLFVTGVNVSVEFFSEMQLVEAGDVIQGHVVAKRYSGLAVQITSFVDSCKYRELSDLSIRVGD